MSNVLSPAYDDDEGYTVRLLQSDGGTFRITPFSRRIGFLSRNFPNSSQENQKDPSSYLGKSSEAIEMSSFLY